MACRRRCCRDCNWCSRSFDELKALITPYGIVDGPGSLFTCCTTLLDGVTQTTNQTASIDPGFPTTSPPCEFDHEAEDIPICYYRRRFSSVCETADAGAGGAGVITTIEIRFYVYQSGADLRGAVYWTIEEVGTAPSVHGATHTTIADFLIAANATKVACLGFSLTAHAFTPCSTVGSLLGCSLPTTFDLAMAVV